MDSAALLDHRFTVAAYAITWILQLGYLAWIGLRWRAQRAPSKEAQKGRP